MASYPQKDGYPPTGYPQQGYPPQGYPPQGYPPQGYPPQGYPPQGYPPQGFSEPHQHPFGYPPPPQQQQQQQAPSYDAGYASNAALNSGHSGGFHPEKFNPRPKYNDLWAAVLFAVHLAAFVFVSYLAISAIKTASGNAAPANNGPSAIFSDPGVIITLVVSALLAFALSAGYFSLMERYASFMIKATFIASIVINVVFALFLIVNNGLLGGIIALAFAAIYVMCWFWWRSRIPFATVMLETVTSVTKKYKGVFAVAVFGLAFHLAYSVYFAFTVVGIIAYTEDPAGSCRTVQTRRGPTTECPSSGKRAALIVFALFSYYWVCQVVKSVVHVTISGVFAAYYFLEGSPQGVPSSPTIGAFKRAVTTSFGSICFGSLIIALLRTARALIRNAAQDSDNACGAFLLLCFSCILEWIESLVQYFNHYAFTQVAIYGKDFCTAAKDTWRLIKDRGIEAIINDNLIDNVLTIGSLLVAGLTGLLVYAYVQLVNPSFADTGATTLVVLIGLLFGFTMMNLLGEVITSGTATTFVALAEDPEALARTKPQLYEKIRQTYPEVAVGI